MQKNIPAKLKLSNCKIVYDAIAVHDGLSRAEIARLTGISGATIIKIADYLQKKNIVRYDSDSNEKKIGTLGGGGETAAFVGRKPTPIRFNANFAYVIVLYMEGIYTYIGILNSKGEVILSRELKIADAEQFIKKDIFNAIDALISKSAIDKTKLVGMGLAIPATLDTQSLKVFRAPLFSQTRLSGLKVISEELAARYNLPVFVENDVNAAAFGEYRRLYSQRLDNLVYISLGTGLGSGVIINRKLWRGENAGAGEIGYMLYNQRYEASNDSLGWLESKININAINHKFRIEQKFNIEVPGEIDNKLKVEIARYISKYISLTILNMTAVLDIKTVVLGGVLPLALKEYLIPQIVLQMKKISRRVPDLVYGELPEPGLAGLCCIIMDSLLDGILR